MLDSFELNKILGAILGTFLITLSLNIIAGSIFTPKKPAQPGYDIPVSEQPAAGGGAAVQEEPIEQLLANAKPEKGASVAKKCLACHDFAKGGPNKVGPNQWGILGAPHAHKEDYNYSKAMSALHDKPWTYEALDEFIAAPAATVPGTKMTFAGVKKPEERADIILYLRSLSDNPEPLPK